MKNNLIFSNNFLWPRQTNWLTFYTHLFQTVYKLVFKSTTNQSQYLINQINKRVSWGSFSKKLINCQPKKPLPKVSHSWSFFEVLIQICGHQNLPYFSIHSSLKSFFFFQTSHQYYTLNVSKFYARWTTTYKLLLNIFYFNIDMLVFSTKVFRTEATAFNWALTRWDYTLFKQVTPYFFLKDMKHGHTSLDVLSIFSENAATVTLITDFQYHEKNSQFLKRLGNYVVSVVPWNFNPWVVNYPIIGGTGGLIIEYFYLTLLSFFRQYSQLIRYSEILSLWRSI